MSVRAAAVAALLAELAPGGLLARGFGLAAAVDRAVVLDGGAVSGRQHLGVSGRGVSLYYIHSVYLQLSDGKTILCSVWSKLFFLKKMLVGTEREATYNFSINISNTSNTIKPHTGITIQLKLHTRSFQIQALREPGGCSRPCPAPRKRRMVLFSGRLPSLRLRLPADLDLALALAPEDLSATRPSDTTLLSSSSSSPQLKRGGFSGLWNFDEGFVQGQGLIAPIN